MMALALRSGLQKSCLMCLLPRHGELFYVVVLLAGRQTEELLNDSSSSVVVIGCLGPSVHLTGVHAYLSGGDLEA